MDSLGDRPLDARPPCIFRLEALRLLPVTCGLKCVVMVAIPDLEHPRLGRGLDAARTDGTTGTAGFRKPDLNRGVALPVLACKPLHTCFALGAGCALLLPIQHELPGREAIRTACLPTAIWGRWTKQVDVPVMLTCKQVICRDIAGIDDMRAWRQVP